MTLFVNLPLDLQRLICFYFLNHDDIKKLSPKFYENEDDVYWKEKVSTVTNKKTPQGASHREYYEYFIYEKFLRYLYWDKELTKKMVDDEIFLTRHIDAQDIHGATSLTRAALFSEESFIKLLSAGANVNHQDKNGYAPLMCVGCRKNIKKKEHVKLLLNMGANVNLQNNNSSTTLMMACQDSEEEIVKLLLDAGADVNLINYRGWTALIFAAQHANEKIVQMVIDAGAVFNVQNCEGFSPLMMAVYREREEMVKILLAAGANVNLQNQYDKTALIIGVQTSNQEVVKLLLEAGADVNLRDRYGQTAFSCANEEIRKLLSSYKV